MANIHQIVAWPKPNEFQEYAGEFDKIGRYFPNVIGTIDGLHLEMELMQESKFEPSFINYKLFHSMQLQVRQFTYFSFCHVKNSAYQLVTVVLIIKIYLGCCYI